MLRKSIETYNTKITVNIIDELGTNKDQCTHTGLRRRNDGSLLVVGKSVHVCRVQFWSCRSGSSCCTARHQGCWVAVRRTSGLLVYARELRDARPQTQYSCFVDQCRTDTRSINIWSELKLTRSPGRLPQGDNMFREKNFDRDVQLLNC